jgi:anti-anti-sigma regulatory factor
LNPSFQRHPIQRLDGCRRRREIDISTAPELANVFNDFEQESVIVDLSAVTFIDSSG